MSFRWFFNNSEHQEWKDHGDFTQSGLKSQIEFLPKTSKDYGNLYCIAENAIGVQEDPCSFQIVPTGRVISWLYYYYQYKHTARNPLGYKLKDIRTVLMLLGTQFKCKTREKQTNKTTGDIFGCFVCEINAKKREISFEIKCIGQLAPLKRSQH